MKQNHLGQKLHRFLIIFQISKKVFQKKQFDLLHLISNLNILLPVILGAIVGFLGLSHGISYVLKKFYNSTISLLTGFVVGSLLIIWPWKVALETIVGRGGELKVVSYSWVIPDLSLSENIFCLILIFLGIFIVWLIEYLGSKINGYTLESYNKTFVVINEELLVQKYKNEFDEIMNVNINNKNSGR